ncbi:MAG: YegP family protein [Arenicellales bacterium]
MPGKFELYKDKAGQFRFRLKASNGEIILASEGYKTKASAKNGVSSVQKNSQQPTRFQKKDSKGKFMFNLTATNGQVVGTSERYDTEKSRDAGIQSVTRHANGASVVDMS